jgi:ABC-type multidrug transport system fused ATPase/permease subunit
MASPSTGLLRRVARLFRPYRGRVAFVVILILVTSGLGVVNPLLIRQVFDGALFCGAGRGCPNLPLLYQLVALMIAIGWFAVAENALAILVPGVSRFLPGGVLSGVDTQGLHLLPLYASLPLLAAWVVAVGTLALRTTLGHDIK